MQRDSGDSRRQNGRSATKNRDLLAAFVSCANAGFRKRREAGEGSNFGPFGQRERIIDIYAEVSDCILDVGMAEQDLYGAEIACGFVNQRRLRSSHRVRATLPTVETNR